MTGITGRVESVHAGSNDLGKESRQAIEVALDGIVGNRHRSYRRRCWAGDKQPKGTLRRNERQWSAVSSEELDGIRREMGLDRPLSPASLGANLCLSGVPSLSRLPRGTLLRFPSGAELLVEEYNPPCLDMGRRIASAYKTITGEPLQPTAFSKAAKLTRGIVGVVEAPGSIRAGDPVTVIVYETPAWLRRPPDG